MPVYVIGHKNPDTDAICSAIAYAVLLRETGKPDAVAVRCGEINTRTLFALDEAKIEHPPLLMDLRVKAGFFSSREVLAGHIGDSIHEVITLMRDNSLRSIPILNGNNSVEGLVSLNKVLDTFLPERESVSDARKVNTSLERIRRVLGGTFQNAHRIDHEQDFILSVAAMSADSLGKRLHHYDPEKLLLVVGVRPTALIPTIEYRARAIIVTGEYELPENLLQRAKENHVTILRSPYDTATTTLLVKCAKRINDSLHKNYLSFKKDVPINSILNLVRESPQTLFPIMDDDGRLSGVLTKSDLVNPPKQQVVLVDHNEFSQAANGIEEAEILEVIDHHRIGGGLNSPQPIRFINEPVGSTCTIISKLYRLNSIKPSPQIALCMASGIISDTLHLTSPTTTPVDRESLAWLESLVGIKLADYANRFFQAGSAMLVSTADEIVSLDCKEYSENGWRVGIAQVEELGLDTFWPRRDELSEGMKRLIIEKELDFAALLITDITEHYSVLLVEGEQKLIDAFEYPPLGVNLFELDGIVSRKKQLLPQVIRILQQNSKT